MRRQAGDVGTAVTNLTNRALAMAVAHQLQIPHLVSQAGNKVEWPVPRDAEAISKRAVSSWCPSLVVQVWTQAVRPDAAYCILPESRPPVPGNHSAEANKRRLPQDTPG
jgi:hypothetical protein